MEYSTNDFYLKFKTLYNKEGKFIDYVLCYLSNSFYKITKMNPESFLGKRFSDIVVDNADIPLCKEIYINLRPNSNFKVEKYIESLKRWYLIQICQDESADDDMLFIHFIDIENIKFNFEKSAIETYMNTGTEVSCKDKIDLYYKDKLTGLYNRNFFEEELSRIDISNKLPISFIVGDLNGLKLINDAFGHGMGDKTLKRVAEIMKSSFREDDIISRVSGDEFIVLLPNTSEEIALKIIERIKKKCELNPLDYIKISISFGLATKVVENENIETVLKKAEDRMYFRKLKESKEAKLSIINFLKTRLQKITYETSSHYERLKVLTMMMAEELNLNETQRNDLILLCEYHDIGKVGISEDILQKTGSLSQEEWKNTKRHSEIGYYIAREIRSSATVEELILSHHERWDGNGYPGFYKEEEIPLTARIFAIADAYDVMVNDRPYKSRMAQCEALKEIKDQSGKQFDPNLAKLFIDLIKKKQKAV